MNLLRSLRDLFDSDPSKLSEHIAFEWSQAMISNLELVWKVDPSTQRRSLLDFYFVLKEAREDKAMKAWNERQERMTNQHCPILYFIRHAIRAVEKQFGVAKPDV